MIQDLDIYVLIENVNIASIQQFIAKWTQSFDEPLEYLVNLSDNSFLEFDNIEDFLIYVLQENVHAGLY